VKHIVGPQPPPRHTCTVPRCTREDVGTIVLCDDPVDTNNGIRPCNTYWECVRLPITGYICWSVISARRARRIARKRAEQNLT